MRLPLRRFFVSSAALLLAAFASGGAAGAQAALVTVHVAGVPTDDLTPVFYGVKAGLYQKAGLDVQIVPTSSGTAATTAVVAGTYEIGKASLISVMVAHLRNFPIALVAGGAVWDPKVPFAQLLAAKDTTFKVGPEMNGKTIGVPALNDLNTLVTSAWVDKLGGDSKTLKFVEIPNSAATAALVSHRIDACVEQDPQTADALATGQVRSLAPAYSSISNHFMFGAYFVNTDWAKTHLEAAKTFGRVTYQAAAYTNTHHAETATMMSEITKIPLAIFSKMDRVQSATSADPGLMQPLIDAAAKYHQIPRGFPAAELYLNG